MTGQICRSIQHTTSSPRSPQYRNQHATFGRNPVDAATIRENTKELIVRGANELTDNLNEKAMQVRLQRVVGADVASACGAGQLCTLRVTQVRDLTSSVANEARDKDRGGPYGFEDRAARARLFAAAEGAVSAFAHITGENWKPYEPADSDGGNDARKSAAAAMAAFGG